MARRCSICCHRNREQINRDLLGADPLLRIAKKWKVAESSLRRHRDNHLSPRLANTLARREDVSAERLVAWLIGVNEQLLARFRVAADANDHGAARGYLVEVRRNLELVGRLGGYLDTGPSVQVTIDQRRQQAAFASLSEDDLRAIVAAAREGLPSPALELEVGAEAVEAEVVG